MVAELPVIVTFAVAAVAARSGCNLVHTIKFKIQQYKVKRKARVERRRKDKAIRRAENLANPAMCTRGKRFRAKFSRDLFKRKKRTKTSEVLEVSSLKTEVSQKEKVNGDDLMTFLYHEMDAGTRQSVMLHCKGSCSEMGGYEMARRIPIKHLSKDNDTGEPLASMPDYGITSILEEYTKYKLYDEPPVYTAENPCGGLKELRSYWDCHAPLSRNVSLKRTSSIRRKPSTSSSRNVESVRARRTTTSVCAVSSDGSLRNSIASTETNTSISSGTNMRYHGEEGSLYAMGYANPVPKIEEMIALPASGVLNLGIDSDPFNAFSETRALNTYSYYLATLCPDTDSDTMSDSSTLVYTTASSNNSRVLNVPPSSPLSTSGTFGSDTRSLASRNTSTDLSTYLNEFVNMYNLAEYVIPTSAAPSLYSNTTVSSGSASVTRSARVGSLEESVEVMGAEEFFGRPDCESFEELESLPIPEPLPVLESRQTLEPLPVNESLIASLPILGFLSALESLPTPESLPFHEGLVESPPVVESQPVVECESDVESQPDVEFYPVLEVYEEAKSVLEEEVQHSSSNFHELPPSLYSHILDDIDFGCEPTSPSAIDRSPIIETVEDKGFTPLLAPFTPPAAQDLQNNGEDSKDEQASAVGLSDGVADFSVKAEPCPQVEGPDLARRPSILNVDLQKRHHKRHRSERKKHHHRKSKHSHKKHHKHHRHRNMYEDDSEGVTSEHGLRRSSSRHHRSHKRHSEHAEDAHRSHRKHRRHHRSHKKHHHHRKSHKKSSHRDKEEPPTHPQSSPAQGMTDEDVNRYLGEYSEFFYMYQMGV